MGNGDNADGESDADYGEGQSDDMQGGGGEEILAKAGLLDEGESSNDNWHSDSDYGQGKVDDAMEEIDDVDYAQRHPNDNIREVEEPDLLKQEASLLNAQGAGDVDSDGADKSYLKVFDDYYD